MFPVYCPVNKHMGGVDNNDQLRGYYHVRLKCRKYYKYVFWFLFDVAITNGFILCKHFTDLGITNVRSFRKQLAKALIGTYCSRKCPGRPSLSLQPSKRFCTSYFPVRGAEKHHRCHYCSQYRHEQHGTVWYCNDCKLYLCHNGR